ncbi:hypothetical protein EI555_015839, partial [Monodon monoceros]
MKMMELNADIAQTLLALSDGSDFEDKDDQLAFPYLNGPLSFIKIKLFNKERDPENTMKCKAILVEKLVKRKPIGLSRMDNTYLLAFYGMFKGSKMMQINLTGFLKGKSGTEFMGELWPLFLSAQENIAGILSVFLELKKEEIKQRQIAQEKLASIEKQDEDKEKRDKEEKESSREKRELSQSPRRCKSRSPSLRRLSSPVRRERESAVILNLPVTEPRARVLPLLQRRRKKPELPEPSVKVKEPSVQEATSTSDILKVPKPEPVPEPKEPSPEKNSRKEKEKEKEKTRPRSRQDPGDVLALLLILDREGTIDPDQDHTHLEGGQAQGDGHLLEEELHREECLLHQGIEGSPPKKPPKRTSSPPQKTRRLSPSASPPRRRHRPSPPATPPPKTHHSLTPQQSNCTRKSRVSVSPGRTSGKVTKHKGTEKRESPSPAPKPRKKVTFSLSCSSASLLRVSRHHHSKGLLLLPHDITISTTKLSGLPFTTFPTKKLPSHQETFAFIVIKAQERVFPEPIYPGGLVTTTKQTAFALTMASSSSDLLKSSSCLKGASSSPQRRLSPSPHSRPIRRVSRTPEPKKTKLPHQALTKNPPAPPPPVQCQSPSTNWVPVVPVKKAKSPRPSPSLARNSDPEGGGKKKKTKKDKKPKKDKKHKKHKKEK